MARAFEDGFVLTLALRSCFTQRHMRKTMKKSLALAAFTTLFLTTGALATDCVLHLKRVACAGQEAKSFERCANGGLECDTEDAATTAAACSAAANRECANDRVDVTKFKVVTATFEGKTLTGGFADDGKAEASGANFCAAGRPDMYKCK
jgi:hypothetical protein